MAFAWFICPYTHYEDNGKHGRYCSMNDFTPAIHGEGGWWAESEILGDVALVKVRASEATLTTISNAPGYLRVLNKWLLADNLTDLTLAQYNAIRNRLVAIGYTNGEINSRMGSNLSQWQTKTFLDLLSFAATRRRKPRWDEQLGKIVCDGVITEPRSVLSVDQEVK